MAMKIDLKPNVAKSQAQNALSEMLGGGSANDRLVDIDVGLLVPWSSEQYNQTEQPFDMYDPDQLQDLANSILRHGVQQPIVVRPMGEQYQILAGHNRTAAAKLAGLGKVPAIVQDVDEATAMLIVVDTNLNQRPDMKPSTRAQAYQLRNELIGEQGRSSKKSTAEIATLTGENLRQVQRYLRLNSLTPDLLAVVDDKRVSVRAGVNLSYIAPEQQDVVARILQGNPDLYIQIPESELLKKLSLSGDWKNDQAEQIINHGQQRIDQAKEQKKEKKPAKEKPNVPEQETLPLPEPDDIDERYIKVPFSSISEYFTDPNPTDEEIIKVIGAHFEYLDQKFGDQFMAVYRTEQMAMEE